MAWLVPGPNPPWFLTQPEEKFHIFKWLYFFDFHIMISSRFYQANKKICLIHFNSFCDKVNLSLMFLRSRPCWNMEWKNTTRTSQEWRSHSMRFSALNSFSLCSEQYSLYLYHGHNQSCVAVFFSRVIMKKISRKQDFLFWRLGFSSKRGRTLFIETMVLIIESIPVYQKQHIL